MLSFPRPNWTTLSRFVSPRFSLSVSREGGSKFRLSAHLPHFNRRIWTKKTVHDHKVEWEPPRINPHLIKPSVATVVLFTTSQSPKSIRHHQSTLIHAKPSFNNHQLHSIITILAHSNPKTPTKNHTKLPCPPLTFPPAFTWLSVELVAVVVGLLLVTVPVPV